MKENLYEKRSRQKQEYLFWSNKIGKGTKDEQKTALENMRTAYRKLLEIEAEIRG